MTDCAVDAITRALSGAALAGVADADADAPLARSFRITAAGSAACEIGHAGDLHRYADGTRMSAAMQQFLLGGFDGDGRPVVALWEIVTQFLADAERCADGTPLQRATGVLFQEIADGAQALADEACARGFLERAG